MKGITILATALCLAGLGGCASNDTPSRGSGVYINVDARSLLGAFVAFAEARVAAALDVTKVLAETEAVKSGDWERMRPLLAAFKRTGLPSLVFYVRTDGSYWTVSKGRQKKNLSDRFYWPRLMAGETVDDAFVVSKSTGRKEVVLGVPVKKGGKVVGVVAAALFLDALGRDIDRALELPKDMVFFALAPNGICAVNRNPKLDMNMSLKQPSPTVRAAFRTMLAKRSGEVSYRFRGMVRHAVFRRSRALGWTFVIGMTVGRYEWTPETGGRK